MTSAAQATAALITAPMQIASGSAKVATLSRLITRARKELQRARQLIIFPEGTRRPPGAEPSYKPGVALLYTKLDVACVPMALNSGLFWPRRSLRPPQRKCGP